MKRLLQSLTVLAVSLAATLLLIEVALRFLPVNDGLRTQPVDQAHPYLHFQPDRTATWSRFPDFSMRNTVRVNNVGFVSDLDYDPSAPSPLIAVIGDSYVEAAMVPWADTVHGRLTKALEPDVRVYSFGASGAPLSQYLAYAEYVHDTFDAQAMVFVVVGNDFDESLLRYKSLPGFHYFQETGQGLKLVRKDFSPSFRVRVLRLSSLARYLVTNVQLAGLGQRLFHGDKGSEYVGQTRADAGEQRLALSRQAVDAFLDRLPEVSGLPPQRILFLVDGLRPALYEPERLAETKTSYAALMREYLLQRAQALGFGAVDLQPLFIRDFQEHGLRFEFPKDGHWNGQGHRVAFQAVLDSGLVQAVAPR